MEPRDVLEGNLFGLPGNPYLDQRFFMRDTVRWPRVERVAPSLTKVDQSLVNHALGNSCSSFQVEWTYAEGTGEASVPNPIDGIHRMLGHILRTASSLNGIDQSPIKGKKGTGKTLGRDGLMAHSHLSGLRG